MLVLKHSDGRTVKEGDEAKTFRGEPVIITGWQQPRHAASSGRVNVRYKDSPGSEMEFYPGVCNLHWNKEPS